MTHALSSLLRRCRLAVKKHIKNMYLRNERKNKQLLTLFLINILERYTNLYLYERKIYTYIYIYAHMYVLYCTYMFDITKMLN